MRMAGWWPGHEFRTSSGCLPPTVLSTTPTRRGPLAAMENLARPDARAVAVTAMVPSLTAVDDIGRPLTPGLLYGDSRGRGPAGGDTTFLTGEAVEFLRWTAREAPD